MLDDKLKLVLPDHRFYPRPEKRGKVPQRGGARGIGSKMLKWLKLNWRSLRFRLIGWYVLLLVLTLSLFSVYIFFQFRNLEQTQQDNVLQAAANNMHNLVDQNGRALHFRLGQGDGPSGMPADLSRENIQLRLLDQNGQVVDSQGSLVSEMPQAVASQPGFTTLTTGASGQWRIYSVPVMSQGGLVGWLQIGQPVFLLNTQVSSLFTPIILGTSIALLLAVLGGLFLANQALTPIDRVTRTAQSISAHQLSRRINYEGPDDEIGRLAKTLDQMLDRLESGFEQERRFTSDASHELRTPLTALKGQIEVTLSRPRTAEEYQQTLDELHHEVDRLVRLSSSLLYLARLDQAGHNWQSDNLNLSELLDSIVESMLPLADLKEVSLLGNITPDLHVQGNLDQLTRLFFNLLDNALKYTPAKGQVVVQVKKPAGSNQVEVAIRDSGPGIAAEHLPHLFKRFYRVENDRAASSGGAGLGLAIAYEIARQHNAKLEIESRPGYGTTLKVLFSLQPALAPV
jgi:heavy metal sensor kinase